VASTPSGGTHHLVAPLGVRKAKPLAGIDVQAGDPDGKGRGFVWIAPTVKNSKVTGEPGTYSWTKPPDFAEITNDAPSDDSGVALAELVESSRGHGSPTGTGGYGIGAEVDIFADELDGGNTFLCGVPTVVIPQGKRESWTFAYANWLRSNDLPRARAL
jgi:hypothetical protein